MAGQDENNDLPDTIGLTLREVDHYYTVWAWWRATDKRFLPSQILSESNETLTVILEIDGYYEKIAAQIREEEDGREVEDSN